MGKTLHTSRRSFIVQNPFIHSISASNNKATFIHLPHPSLLIRTTLPTILRPLSISLSSIITIRNNQILWSIIMLSAQVALQDRLCAIRVSLLGIQRRAGHVGHHGVSATEGVLGVAENVLFGCGLREPDVTAVAAEVAGFEGVGDVFFDDDGAAGGVD